MWALVLYWGPFAPRVGRPTRTMAYEQRVCRGRVQESRNFVQVVFGIPHRKRYAIAAAVSASKSLDSACSRAALVGPMVIFLFSEQKERPLRRGRNLRIERFLSWRLWRACASRPCASCLVPATLPC